MTRTENIRVLEVILDHTHNEESKEALRFAINSLKAEQPITGKWTHDGSHWKNRFICSECGYKLFDEPTNFCPNCGVDMRGDTE